MEVEPPLGTPVLWYTS